MKTKNIILLILFAIPFKLAAQINLTLDDCLELATENNAGLRNAELDILYAKARKSETFTYYFPTVKANAVAFHFAEPLFTLTANDLLGTSDLANDISRYFNMLAQMYNNCCTCHDMILRRRNNREQIFSDFTSYSQFFHGI